MTHDAWSASSSGWWEGKESAWTSHQNWDKGSWDQVQADEQERRSDDQWRPWHPPSWDPPPWYPASSGGWNAASSGGWNEGNRNTCRDWQNSQWNERADDCHNNARRKQQQRNIEAQMAPKAAERWQAAAPPEAPATSEEQVKSSAEATEARGAVAHARAELHASIRNDVSSRDVACPANVWLSDG